MATYTKINLSDITDIIADFAIGAVVDFENLSGGQANSSYKLETTAGRFVVSICDEKGFAEVNQLAGVLKHMEGQGFSTTRVVSTADGRLVTRFRDKPVLIKRYLEGRVPRRMSPPRLHALGREIARLHGLKAPEGIGETFPYDLAAFDQVIHSEADELYRKWLQAKKAYLEKNTWADLPRGLVHGDIFTDNTLFREDELVAIIDFEEACRTFTVFDLGMCITGTCCTSGRVGLGKASSLIEGYQSVRPLVQAEKKHLQAFVIYGAVATSFWRFRQYNILLPGHARAGTYAQMNQIADQVQAIPANLFLSEVIGS